MMRLAIRLLPMATRAKSRIFQNRAKNAYTA
jgi:hypothetical protein